jgi:hypothetical protein
MSSDASTLFNSVNLIQPAVLARASTSGSLGSPAFSCRARSWHRMQKWIRDGAIQLLVAQFNLEFGEGCVRLLNDGMDRPQVTLLRQCY